MFGILATIYVEVVPFIPVTFMVFFSIILLSIKIIGPLQPIPKDKNELSPAMGEAYTSFLMGIYTLMMVILNLISYTSKPYYTSTYLIDTNRLFMTIIIVLMSLWFCAEILIAPSRWKLIVYLSSAIIFIVLDILLAAGTFTGGSENVKIEEFLTDSFILLFVVGIIGWIIVQWGIRSFSKGDGERAVKMLAPIWLLSKKAAKFLRSSRGEFVKLLLLFGFFLLSWADIPVF